MCYYLRIFPKIAKNGEDDDRQRTTTRAKKSLRQHEGEINYLTKVKYSTYLLIFRVINETLGHYWA